MRKLFIYLGISVFILGCKKEPELITQSHDLNEFNHVRLFDSFNTILHESDEFRIEITADEDRIEFINFSISDSILNITNDKVSKWSNPNIKDVEIHIYSEPLSLVEVEESGFVSTATPITTEEFGIIMKSKVNEANLELNCGTFYYWNNVPSGGKLKLTGQSDVTKIWNHALMNVDAKDLVTNTALVSNSSKGIIEVAPLVKLEYSIFDVGDILLYSSPATVIEIENTGSGSLIQQ